MDAYNSFILDSMKSDDNWVIEWLYPLLNAIGTQPQGHSFESSLVEILKKQPQLIRHLEKWFEMDASSCSRLRVYITAVQVCRKLGLWNKVQHSGPALWSNMVNIDVFQQALEHSDSKVFIHFTTQSH